MSAPRYRQAWPGSIGLTPGTLALRSRTFAALSAALLRAGVAVGTRAALWGPALIVGWWRRAGASTVALDSELDLTAADAIALPSGAPGSGAPIIYLGGSDPVTWGTPGASGGLILDGTGPIALPCVGQLVGAGAISISALCWPTVTTAADGQAVLAGTTAAARTNGIRGGARHFSGAWYGAWSVGAPPTPTTGGTATAEYARSIATGRELELIMSQVPCDSTNQRAAYALGAYTGDETGTSDLQQGSTGSTSAMVSAVDHEVVLDVVAGSGELSARFTSISVLNRPRAAGIAA
jgi:hypothetical protein